MRQLGRAAVCLCIAMALGAIGASGAAASKPEIGRCVKTAVEKTGKYTTVACTALSKTSTGDYEWFPGYVEGKNHFTGTSIKATLETIHKVKVTCTGEKASGEYTSNKTVGNVNVTFTGCVSLAKKCKTEGAAEGEVKVNTLSGQLVWENKPLKKVAVDLVPQSEEYFVTFRCGPAESKVRGSVLVNIPAGKMETTFVEKFTQKEGKQKPTEYETEEGTKVPDFLEADLGATEFVQAGQTVANTQTNEEALEVNWFV